MASSGIRVILAAGLALVLCSACRKDNEEVVEDRTLYAVRSERLRVMSFNVRHSGMADEGDHVWSKRKYPCVRMLRDVNPDIIGFQETYEDQIEYFASALAGEYTAFRIPKELKQFANVIFYRNARFDFVDGGYRWYSVKTPESPSPTYPDVCNDGAYRTFMWVRLRLKGTDKVVWLFDTHLPWNPDKTAPNDVARRRCIEAIVALASEVCGEEDTVFVTGDMNCAFSTEAGRTSLAALDEWMTAAQKGVPQEDRDDWRSSNAFGSGAPYKGIAGSIDHIFYRNAAPVAYRTVVSPDYGVRFLSDHYPIYLDCTVEYLAPVVPVFGSSMEGFGEDDGYLKLEK